MAYYKDLYCRECKKITQHSVVENNIGGLSIEHCLECGKEIHIENGKELKPSPSKEWFGTATTRR